MGVREPTHISQCRAQSCIRSKIRALFDTHFPWTGISLRPCHVHFKHNVGRRRWRACQRRKRATNTSSLVEERLDACWRTACLPTRWGVSGLAEEEGVLIPILFTIVFASSDARANGERVETGHLQAALHVTVYASNARMHLLANVRRSDVTPAISVTLHPHRP